MAEIDLSHEASIRLVTRLQGEYGSLAVANFALSNQLDVADAQLAAALADSAAKNASILDLNAQIEGMGAELDKLRKAADPARAHLFKRDTKPARYARKAS